MPGSVPKASASLSAHGRRKRRPPFSRRESVDRATRSRSAALANLYSTQVFREEFRPDGRGYALSLPFILSPRAAQSSSAPRHDGPGAGQHSARGGKAHERQRTNKGHQLHQAAGAGDGEGWGSTFHSTSSSVCAIVTDQNEP